MGSTIRRNMAWANEGQLSVVVHSRHSPAADEWSDYVSDVAALGPLSSRKLLIISRGGGPSSAQRRQLFQAVHSETAAPTALITDSPLMRGIGTAIGWFNRLLRVFNPDHIEAALDYLELTPEERSRMRELVEELEGRLAAAVSR